MDTSKDPPARGGTPSHEKVKRPVKGSTLKPKGVTKSAAIKRNPMARAMHRFAADPNKKRGGKALKALELVQAPATYPTNPSANLIDEQFPFQQIETPATMGQSYASTMYTSPNLMTNAGTFMMDSATLTAEMRRFADSTLGPDAFTSSAPALHPFINSIPALYSINNSTPALQPYANLPPELPSFNPTSFNEQPLNRKRSADASKGSDPKRQKTDIFNPLNPLTMNLQNFSAPTLNFSHARVHDSFVPYVVAPTQGAYTYEQGIGKFSTPLPTPARGYDIASLLNPQKTACGRTQNALEPAHNPPATLFGAEYIPPFTAAAPSGAAADVSTRGEGSGHFQNTQIFSPTDANRPTHLLTANLASQDRSSLLALSSEAPSIGGNRNTTVVGYSQGTAASSQMGLASPVPIIFANSVHEDHNPLLTSSPEDTSPPSAYHQDTSTDTSNFQATGEASVIEPTYIQSTDFVNGDHISPLASHLMGRSTPLVGGENIAMPANHREGIIPFSQIGLVEHVPVSSSSLGNGDQAPLFIPHLQGTSAPLASILVATPPNPVHDTSASSQNSAIEKKRKYEASEDVEAENNSKRAKIEVAPTKAAKSKGGRPKNPPKPPRVRTSLPTLTSKNPVKEFPLDLWGMVFGFSAPRFLLKAQLASPLFNLALQYTKVWESARHTTHPDCPDPPYGMSEKEYAFHLDGAGCQAVSNGVKCPEKCRRTYWAFQKKWCANHLKDRLISAKDVQTMEAAYPDLRRLVPSASFDSWDTYLCAGSYTAKPAWLRCLPYRMQYLKGDIEEVRREYDSIRAPRDDGSTRTPAEILAWADGKRAEVETKVKKRQDIEAWVETKKRAELTQHQDLTQAKKDFYRAKALAMEPPLVFEALEHTLAYQKAIAIKKAPSERSWQILEEKLVEQRKYAEWIVDLDQAVHHRGIPPDDRLAFRPYGVPDDMTKEGRLVKELAQAQIAAAILAFPDPAATDEWVPWILRRFYEAFEALPDYQKLDDDGIKISLTMYHAKVVVQEIEAHFQVARGNPIPQHLTVKCPLCPHKGASTTRSFDRHVTHVGQKHARSHVGFSEWRMYENRGFSWMRVSWPPNMPVLRNSEVSKEKWDLGGD